MDVYAYDASTQAHAMLRLTCVYRYFCRVGCVCWQRSPLPAARQTNSDCIPVRMLGCFELHSVISAKSQTGLGGELTDW